MIAAGTLTQKAKAFRRGKAISLAPIISGTRIVAHGAHAQQDADDHHDAMQAHHRVVGSRFDNLHPRLGQLGAEDQREDSRPARCTRSEVTPYCMPMALWSKVALR